MKKILMSLFFLYNLTNAKAAGNLQLDLETCYKNYSDAINDHNISKIQENMSEHGFRHLKNLIASQKLKYPEDLIIEASAEMVILKKERFISVKENANTAIGIYYGKSFNYSKALILLTFVKEGNTWKFDNIEEKSSDDLISKVESNNLGFLQNDFIPSSVPSVDAEINSVDYSGLFNLQAQGYNISLKINGISQKVSNGTIVNGVVMGGLKEGMNHVEIEFMPKENVEKSNFKLSIRAYIDNAERDMIHIYEAGPKETISKDFEVKSYSGDAH